MHNVTAPSLQSHATVDLPLQHAVEESPGIVFTGITCLVIVANMSTNSLLSPCMLQSIHIMGCPATLSPPGLALLQSAVQPSYRPHAWPLHASPRLSCMSHSSVSKPTRHVCNIATPRAPTTPSPTPLPDWQQGKPTDQKHAEVTAPQEKSATGQQGYAWTKQVSQAEPCTLLWLTAQLQRNPLVLSHSTDITCCKSRHETVLFSAAEEHMPWAPFASCTCVYACAMLL